MKKESYKVIALLIGICLTLAIYVGSTVLNKAKIDLTEEKLYSLSTGTKSVLKKLNTNVRLKLYYSKTAAQKGTEGIRMFNNYFSFVKELLEEYVANSDNRLTLDVIDPRPDTYQEEEANYYGLKKFQLTPSENYYFGLVGKSDTGTEKIIEFFDPNRQENLEYEITKLIYSATHLTKKKVGVLSHLQIVNEEMSPYMAQMMRMQGQPVQDSWIFIKQLRELYEIKKIEPTVDKIEGVDMLMVVHPKNLSEKTQFAIDQFLLNGGKVMVLATPHFLPEATQDQAAMMGMGGNGPDTSSNLKTLFNTWGIDMPEGTFAGDKNLAGMGRLSEYSAPTKILPLVKCDERCVESSKDAISAGLNNMVFLFPGALVKLDAKATNITPIVTTTKEGNTYKANGFELQNPSMLLEKFVPGKEPVSIGLKITGKFKSAFPNGVSYEEEDANKNKVTKKLEGLKESSKESAIVVFSDVDFITDQISYRETMMGLTPSNNNAAMVMNALENLTGSSDLISIRSKGKFTRSFDRIDQIEARAESQTADKVAQINQNIKNFEDQLNALSHQANENNIALLQNQGLKKQKELAKQVAMLKNELRDVKRLGREEIERIGSLFQYINTLFIPSLLLVIGLMLSYSKMRKRQAHR